MSKPACSDQDFIRLFEEHGAAETRRRLKIDIRRVYDRRARLEEKLGRQIRSPNLNRPVTRLAEDHAARLHFEVKNGIVLVGSDAHIWPGKPSTAMRAFVKFCKELRPSLTVIDGDALDFPQISRHPPIGHQSLPKIEDEIEAAQEQLHDIELATPRSCKLVWCLGNHDGRLETRLATVAPEFARLHGHSLKDYFPSWLPCWSVWINDDVVIKHRFKGGVHATHNNTLYAGKHTVTGHLHSAKVTPFTDYNGTRYGVDTGCLADIYAKPFTDYLEDNPRNWRAGFCVLTFKDGKLLFPELVLVWDETHVQWRGEIIKV